MANPNKLPVLEVFGPTIQGEGAMIGVQTSFVRCVHCDYACAMCDSKHAVEPAQYKGKEKHYTAQELFDAVMKVQGSCEWVTISGGNPALWDFSEFVKRCHAHGLRVAVETQGSIFKPWLMEVDQLTISPKGPGMKEPKADVLADLREFIHAVAVEYYRSRSHNIALKIPVFGRADLDFAVKVQQVVREEWEPGVISPKLYLSVGNPILPEESSGGDDVQQDLLLTQLTWVIDTVIAEYPQLSRAIILPQLHVLVWGNKQLV